MPELLTAVPASSFDYAVHPAHPDHPWVKLRRRGRRRPVCVLCGGPSPRTRTCAGCRWLDDQATQRAREWDEIDPARHDWATSRELPWTAQGFLSMEAAAQQAMSPEDARLRYQKEEAEAELTREESARQAKTFAAQQREAQRLAAEQRRQERREEQAAWRRRDRTQEAEQRRRDRARERAKLEEREAETLEERTTAEYRARAQAALDESVRQLQESGSLAMAVHEGEPIQLLILASGQTVFWHDAGGKTCLTQPPVTRCLCGHYTLRWTPV